MNLATDQTLIGLIAQKPLFFSLIDYLDARGEGHEISLGFYFAAVRQQVDSLVDPRERSRVRKLLEPEHLWRSGFLAAWDKARGSLVFQPFLMELFRHLERSRLRELTPEQLESLRLELNHSLQRLQSVPVTQGDAGFEDILQLLMDRLGNVLGRIRQNVASLQGQAEHLSRLIEEENPGDRESVRETAFALQEVNRIYSRHVLPTLRFLNEQEHYPEGLPALTAAGECASILLSAGLPGLSQRIQFAKNSIRSYAKDVENIRKTLERYVRQSALQRHQYDCIEEAYNRLRERVSDLAGGRSRLLDSECLDELGGASFAGLKRHRFDARLEFHGAAQKPLFDEWMRVQLPLVRARHGGTAVAQLSGAGFQEQGARRQALRKEQLKRLAMGYPLPDMVEDLHQQLHEYLGQQLSDYALADLLDALGWVRGRIAGQRLQPSPGLRRIRHAGLCLEYYPLRTVKQQESQTC